MSIARVGSMMGSAGAGLSATQALFAAMTTPPSAGRQAVITTLINALIATGSWALMDALYVLAAADSQAATLNWKNPGVATLVPVNSPTFTVDRGFTGDGATSYLTGADAGGFYVQDSAHLACFMGTDSANDRTSVGFRNSGVIRAHDNGSAAIRRRLNGAFLNTNGLAATAVGHTLCNRNNAANFQTYKAGTQVISDVDASVAVTGTGLGVLAGPTGASPTLQRGAAAHYGGALTVQQIVDTNAALIAYMTSVGAPTT